jgi:tRNA(His) guanylyltransferase
MGLDIKGEMEIFEYFKGNRIPSDVGFIVRLDGSNFSKFTEIYDKPFDKEFHEVMKKILTELFKYYTDSFEVETHSDEISLYFKAETEVFGRRHEKIVSEIAGMASCLLGLTTGELGFFDARIVLMPTSEIFNRYRKDRWLDAFRNCVNSTIYWKLREGLDKESATKKIKSLKSKERQELLFQEFGINIAKLPRWQRQGLRFIRVGYEKEGFDPIKKQKVVVPRTKIEEVDFDIF